MRRQRGREQAAAEAPRETWNYSAAAQVWELVSNNDFEKKSLRLVAALTMREYFGDTFGDLEVLRFLCSLIVEKYSFWTFANECVMLSTFFGEVTWNLIALIKTMRKSNCWIMLCLSEA